MVELGEEVFHLPVRVGVPAYVGGLADVVRSPRYATAVGLLLDGREQYLRAEHGARARQRIGQRRGTDEAMVQGEFLERAVRESACNDTRQSLNQLRQEKGAHHV